MSVLHEKICLFEARVWRLTRLVLAAIFVSGTAFAQSITGLTLSPSTITSGSSSTGTVTLSAAAPAGGFQVDLSSSLSSECSVPSAITIASGEKSGTFKAITVNHSRTLECQVTARVPANSIAANLTILGDGIASLTLAPSTVVSGQNSIATVRLLYPAPAFGWKVNLSTSSAAFDSIPDSLLIPAGASTGTFTVTTVPYGRTVVTTLGAKDRTTAQTVSLTALGDAVSSLTLLPNTVKGGQVTGGTITLVYPAPAWGWTVTLSSTGAPVFMSPSVTIPAGATKVSFSIYTSVEPGNTTSSIIVADKTSSKNQPLTITTGFWLANTPWPKFRGSLQNQGQGLGQGAINTLRWQFSTAGPVWSSPTIGHDGTIYVGSDDYNLYALNPDGTLKWKYTTEGPVRSSPAIGSDETIYVGGGNNLYAITALGTLKWKYTTAGPINTSSPTIQSNGTISIGSSTGFYEITHSGTLQYHWPSGNYQIIGSPAVWGNDLFAGVLSGVNDLFSFGPGSVNWSFSLPVQGSASVGPDGTIYAGSSSLNPNALHAIFPSGKSDWLYNVNGAIESGTAVGADGTIYVASTTELYAFNPNGTLKWSNAIGGSHGSSPSIGSDGTIYVGLAAGSANNGLYAFAPTGALQWMYPTENLVYSSPTINSDGSVYFGCLDGKVYAMTTLSPISCGLFNTGVNNWGVPLPDGTVNDLHYHLISTPSGGTKTTLIRMTKGGYPIPPYLGDDAFSAWIGPDATQLDGPDGSYDYRLNFAGSVGGHHVTKIIGRWSTDNVGTDIQLNGHSTGQTSPDFYDWTSFTISSPAGLPAGNNILDFFVDNQGSGPTGLRVEITGVEFTP